MKKTLQHLLLMTCLSGAAMHGYAGDNMSADEMSRYMGVMRCVDNIFYDGGYDPDDSERIAVMNDVLKRNELPTYNETVYSKIDGMMASKSDGFNFEIFLGLVHSKQI